MEESNKIGEIMFGEDLKANIIKKMLETEINILLFNSSDGR